MYEYSMIVGPISLYSAAAMYIDLVMHPVVKEKEGRSTYDDFIT